MRWLGRFCEKKKKNNVNYTVGILKLGDLLLFCNSDNAIVFSLLGHEYKRRTCEPRLINNSWHAGVVSKDKAELQFFHQTVLIYNNLRKAFIFYTIMRYGCYVKKGNVTYHNMIAQNKLDNTTCNQGGSRCGGGTGGHVPPHNKFKICPYAVLVTQLQISIFCLPLQCQFVWLPPFMSCQMMHCCPCWYHSYCDKFPKN